jgi:N-acetylmuramoyl-L-alanine amidase
LNETDSQHFDATATIDDGGASETLTHFPEGQRLLLNVLRHSATAGLLVMMTVMGRAQIGVPNPHEELTARPAAAAKPARPAAAKSVGAARPSGASVAAVAAPVVINRKVIVLDPAHGGVDSGSRIAEAAVEKDVTLALAYRLRSLLIARGFTVVMTREADAPSMPNEAGTALTLDDRAGIANHAHAAACLVLHATGSGTGVHLYRSELSASAGVPAVVPWLSAQAAWIHESEMLEKQVATAFARSGIAMVASSASVRPIDSLTCPALVVELAPAGEAAGSISEMDYQQRVALAIAGAMLSWQNEVQAPVRVTATTNGAGSRTAADNSAEEQP